LDLFCPFYKLHLFHIIPDIIFPSGLGPSNWSTCNWFPFVYFLHDTDFRHSIYVSKPTQSLSFNIIYYVPVFYWFIQLLVCFNPPNTVIFFSSSSSSSPSVGATARCGLWPVEQYLSICPYLSPTLSIFSLPALEDLFLLLLSILSWVFLFVSSLPVLQ